MNKYIEEAYNQSIKAYKKGDVPVGCVIVENNKIIAKAYNKKEKNKNAILHAEVICIKKACKKKNTWHLDDCILYTTMEPCMMCCGAIIQSRIKKVVFILKNDNYGYTDILKNSKIEVEQVKDFVNMKKTIQKFFKKKRNN